MRNQHTVQGGKKMKQDHRKIKDHNACSVAHGLTHWTPCQASDWLCWPQQYHHEAKISEVLESTSCVTCISCSHKHEENQ